MTSEQFIKSSLEFNLFYLRIMAEHASLFATTLPVKNQDLKAEATQIYQNFSEHLNRGIDLSKGVISLRDDFITKYTLPAEEKTSKLSGFPINTQITKKQLSMNNTIRITPSSNMEELISDFNNKSIILTNNIIHYKTELINDLKKCELFIFVYEHLIEHTRKEAVTFVNILNKLQKRDNPIDTAKEMMDKETFWNEIMGEHAAFIRGMLDPTETLLFNIANETYHKYQELNQNIKPFKEFTLESTTLTRGIKKFKQDGVEGILKCQISGIIPPILADHVLREANHYLHLLELAKTM